MGADRGLQNTIRPMFKEVVKTLNHLQFSNCGKGKHYYWRNAGMALTFKACWRKYVCK